ncbi:MAG: purine-nucleoside phosphorylase [Sphaerochaetaceae bacterium]
MKAPTVHNGAALGQIAETVLLPGDPLRARFIAEQFLTDAECYTKVRGVYGYTGWYKGKRISVQGTGMGGPSMAIYAYELIHAYKAKQLIRIGSAGALQDYLKLGDIVGVTAASYNTDYSLQYSVPGTITPAGSFNLLYKAKARADKANLNLYNGPVLSSDLFYSLDGLSTLEPWKKMGLLAVEMEAASLYLSAQAANIEALCLLTISDLPFKNQEMSSGERERSFTDMISLALDIAAN